MDFSEGVFSVILTGVILKVFDTEISKISNIIRNKIF